MRSILKVVASAIVAAVVLASGATVAAASDGGSVSDETDFGRDEGGVVVEAGDGEEVGLKIDGGRTQSLDPTAYNYVPPVSGSVRDRVLKNRGATVASAGYGSTSPFNYTVGGVTWQIPTGRIYHVVNGSGLNISSEYANWLSSVPTSAQICNAQWQFQNRYGSTVYSTIKTPIIAGCKIGSLPDQHVGVSRTVKLGVLCARLYVNGYYRGEQCHSVFP